MYENNATLRRRDLLIKLSRLLFEDKLISHIDRIAVQMFPKRSDSSTRCCIYKSRAIIKYRTMAILGFSIEDEYDELMPLSKYAQMALEREKVEFPILTVIDEACSSCVKANYVVTNVCRGCFARPCMMNCPKKAISMHDGQAKIDPAKCVNCGLCMKACPYHAVIYVPVPCEESCPVGAITKDELGLEKIDYSKCIYCGKCTRECPFGAIMEKSQIIDVIKQLKSNKKVIAIVAPAVVGQFPAEFEKIVSAIKQAGFADVVEAAIGADITAVKETAEFKERIAHGSEFMTTSCCPAYTEAVKKHVPELEKFVSATHTPMHYIAEIVRKKYRDAIAVFIGPCVAKRKEAIENPYMDYVLTFEELGALFVAKGIEVGQCDQASIENPAQRIGRMFPVSGGVTCAIKETLGTDNGFNPVLIDGLSKQSVKTLKTYAKGACPGNFVEVMSCEGGCVAGPGVLSNPKIAAVKVKNLTK